MNSDARGWCQFEAHGQSVFRRIKIKSLSPAYYSEPEMLDRIVEQFG